MVLSVRGQDIRVKVRDQVRTYRTHHPARLTRQLDHDPRIRLNERWGVLRTWRGWTFSIAPSTEPWTTCSSTPVPSREVDLVARLVPEGGFYVTALSADRESTVPRSPSWARFAPPRRVVYLRGRGALRLNADMDDKGNLDVHMCSLESDTAVGRPVRRWGLSRTVFNGNVPALVGLLGGMPGDDVLDVLEDRWSRGGADDVLRMLRCSDWATELY